MPGKPQSHLGPPWEWAGAEPGGDRAMTGMGAWGLPLVQPLKHLLIERQIAEVLGLVANSAVLLVSAPLHLPTHKSLVMKNGIIFLATCIYSFCKQISSHRAERQ